jgi:protein-S-isoprenylcysteine O-methyltransferase Ste14
MVNELSGSCLLFFGGVYLSKLLLLKYRDRIIANSLGHIGKDRILSRVENTVKWSVYMWIAVWIVNILGYSIFIPFEIDIRVRYIGIALNLLGAILFFISVIVMDKSWRVGIDRNSTTKLVTTGIYKFSRNPAYVAFDSMFLGTAFTFGDIGLVLIGLVSGVSLHKLILMEEMYLEKRFQNVYVDYKNSIRRYF